MDSLRSSRINLEKGGLEASERRYVGRSASRRLSPSGEVVTTRRIIRRASRSLERYYPYRRSLSKSRSPSTTVVNPTRIIRELSRPVDLHQVSTRLLPWYRSANTDAIAVTTIRKYSLSPDRYRPYHPIRRSISRGLSPSTDDVGVRTIPRAYRPSDRHHHRNRSRSRSPNIEAVAMEGTHISSHSTHRRHHHNQRYSSRQRSPDTKITRVKRVTRTVSVSPQRPVQISDPRRPLPYQTTFIKKISRTGPTFPHRHHRHSRIRSRSPSAEAVKARRVNRRIRVSPHRHTLPILRRRSRSRELTKVERIVRRSSRSPHRPRHRFDSSRSSLTASSRF